MSLNSGFSVKLCPFLFYALDGRSLVAKGPYSIQRYLRYLRYRRSPDLLAFSLVRLLRSSAVDILVNGFLRELRFHRAQLH